MIETTFTFNEVNVFRVVSIEVSTVFIHLAAPAAIKSVTCLHINVSNVSQTFGVPDVSLSCLSSIYADVVFLP